MLNALLPRRKGSHTQEENATRQGQDLGTPKGRLEAALGGIIRDLMSPQGKTDPRMQVMVTGLTPLLQQTLRQLTNSQVCELIRNLRQAFDWIEYGPSTTPPQEDRKDADCRGNRDREDNPG